MMVKSWDCSIDMLHAKDKRAAEVYEFKILQWYNKRRKEKYLVSFILGIQIILFIIYLLVR
jgi:hypothetical protein